MMATLTLDLSNLAEAPFHQQVLLLRNLFELTQAAFAKLLLVDEKTIQRWESGQHNTPQSRNKQALTTLVTIAQALGDLLEPDSIATWARTANPALGGERPVDFIKQPGGIYILANKLGAVGQ
jgi:DNA-binding transcriptional regulator YiaG